MLVNEAFGYTKEGLFGKWKKWLLLIVATFLLTLPLMGYTLRIFRGENPSPEVENWGTLFIDGIKYLIVGLIYAIPALIVLFLALAPVIAAASSTSDPAMATAAMMAALGTFFVGLLVFIIVAFIIGIFSSIGIIRFARTGSMGEAFNFSAIVETIGKIGWGHYILALIVMMVIIGIVETICNLIPYAGMVILILILPFIMHFQARYLCMLYDSAGTE